MQTRYCLFLALFLFAFQQKSTAQDSLSTAPTLFQFFSNPQDSIPLLILRTDAKQLVQQKKKEEYQKATLEFSGPDGQLVSFSAKVRARGNMRKQVCQFPPLKIKLTEKELSAIGFDTLDNLKLVIQCRENNLGQDYLHREYLLYKMHQVIGPVSYQTALIRIQLGDRYDEPLFGFLIEDEDEFAQRLNGPVLEEGILRQRLIDRDAYLKMCFFQYLILNTDWFMGNRHNLEFIRPEGFNKFCPVPYDFDYAGLVNTSYAVPHESRNIKTVTEPCYLCEEVNLVEARRIAAYYVQKKEAIYQVVRDYPHLDDKDKQKFIWRLDSFYSELEDDKVLKRNLVNKQ